MLQIPTPGVYAEINTHTLLTIEEAACLIRVSRRQFYRLLTQGTFKYVKLGYRTLIIKDSLMNTVTETEINPLQSMNGKELHSMNSRMKGKNEPATDELTEAQEPQAEPEAFEVQVSTTEKSKRKKKKYKYLDTRPSKKDFAPEGVTHETYYTIAEVCNKFGIRYGALYGIRNRYNVPAVHAWGTTCFPKAELDAAMNAHNEAQGTNLGDLWYSTIQIMSLYGLGKTQIRRFAEQYNVRTKKLQQGHVLYYLKADWETARKESEAKSWNTKHKRELDK